MNNNINSLNRFKHLNMLVDEILPMLPCSSYSAVLLVCYRHASKQGVFIVSTNRIAKSSRLSPRHTQRVIDGLVDRQVIRLLDEHRGPIPRRYQIRHTSFAPPLNQGNQTELHPVE